MRVSLNTLAAHYIPIDAPPPLSISSHSNCGKRQDCQPNEAAISSESVIEAPNQGVAW